MTIIQRIHRKSRFIFNYLKSFLIGNFRQKRYAGIKYFILFVGYPRSGHSLIAALLDAHPDIVISQEWGALSYLRMGYHRNQIFYSIEHHSRLFTRKLKNIWSGYSYRVEGMWQGKYNTIRLIGDKLGGETSLILKKNPALLLKLQHKTGCSVKIIHVIRNPYDTITTMAKRSYAKSSKTSDLNAEFLAPFIDKYFDRTSVIQKLKDIGKFEMLDLYHEDLIKDNDLALKKLLDFLEVDALENYITKCSEAIYKEPHKSRLEFDWPDDLKIKVRENLKKYSFMEHYRFED